MIMITTRYRPHPGSNVGKYQARSLGRQVTARTDLALDNYDNHEQVARALAEKLAGLGIVGHGDPANLRHVAVEDDGRHIWEV